MSEISRISPSEVKPSVGGGWEGGGAGHKHLTRDNTGTTRTHISGAAPQGLECRVSGSQEGLAGGVVGMTWDLLLGVGPEVKTWGLATRAQWGGSSICDPVTGFWSLRGIY